MLTAGSKYTLHLSRFTENGAYLMDEDMKEVLLPKRYVTPDMEEGDSIEVFIYHDSEDRLVATTDTPKIMAGGVASLEVVDITPYGAFLDWGLPKDLFLPKANQLERIEKGYWYVVTAYVDRITGRLVASSKLGQVVHNEEVVVKPGEKVNIIVAQRNEFGFRVVVNQRNWGMIYHNQIFKPVYIGDTMDAYVVRVTEDNRIDLSLQPAGFDGIKNSARQLLELMVAHGSTLSVCDHSTPEEIQKQTQMSKKTFKRAVGYLLKSGAIKQENGYISLMEGYQNIRWE